MGIETVCNRLISAARAGWYAAIEPSKLRILRWLHGPDYLPGDLMYQRDPLVSCYVPTHNRCLLLIERCLPAILGQTYANIEIIVAAHGCTDGTEQLVRAITDRRVRLVGVPRTRTYHPTAENHWLAGPVVPANAALAACRGAYIARCDDDDVWSRDHVERLLSFAQAGDYEFVSGAYSRLRDNVQDVVWSDGENPPAGGTQTWLYRSYLKSFRYNQDCWRKKVNRVNDTDLVDRFRKAGVRMGLLDEVVAMVLPRPGETTIGSLAYLSDPETTERRLAF